MNGVLIVDKPSGWTSHDVVARVRRILKERSVGHLGTLDPSATGLLPLVLGKFTRLAQFYGGAEKVYEGTVRFGFSTDTYDAEGEPTGPPQAVNLSLEQVREAAARFAGSIQQLPPPFSAKKIAGVPAYKLARKKVDVPLSPVTVEFRELEILSLELGCARFRARVSAGTYMRSFAHDLGQALGCGGHLGNLRRTQVAEFSIEQAVSLEALEASVAAETWPQLLVHPRMILQQLPAVTATAEALARIRHGNAANLPEMSRAPLVKVFAGQTELVAIASRIAGTLFQPKVVLISEG